MARLRYRVRDCGRLARAYLAAGGDARGDRGATVRPSIQGMLTISRPPPRRCSAACLLGSAARRGNAYHCFGKKVSFLRRKTNITQAPEQGI